MPRERKPAAQRQNRSTKDLEPVEATVVTLVPASSPANLPEADSSWLAETKREWDAVHQSVLAGYINETDVPGLRRCMQWRDEQRRCMKRARTYRKLAEETPMVEGSTGQLKASPMFELANKEDDRALVIEAKIVALEDRLALSPKARLALGVTEQKGHNLAAQNTLLAQAIAEAMNDAPDPRAVPRNPAVEAS